LNNITECVANNTMVLKGENTCISFVSTVWRGTSILVMYNNLSGKVDSIIFDPVLQEGDVVVIENMIKRFLA